MSRFPLSVGRKSVAALGIVGFLCAATLAAWWWRGRHVERQNVPDPRLTYVTPYRNVRPEVAYVGDVTCARCHQEIAETYRQHPMGRSFSVAKPFEQPATLLVKGFRYAVENLDGRPVHRETWTDGNGLALAEHAAEVRYVLGSGTRGRGYLVEEEGFLFQSPLSWYARKNGWDLSPGYRDNNQHFGRPVLPACLFCHANHADVEPDAVNRYRQPIFRGLAIGCERCHGPGQLHVELHDGGGLVKGAFDDTIVNPKHLEPSIREGVCQQCHLQGQGRFLRHGLQTFDYRPGMPLELFWSVCVWAPGRAPLDQAVGQVEEMVASRCYQASAGKLGCTSCHDPHERPAPARKAAHYRPRCLTCHKETSCKLDPVDRKAKHPDDSCIACHMPARGATDVLHVAVTDHTIRRQDKTAPAKSLQSLEPGELPIRHFHQDLLSSDDLEAPRAMALTMLQMAQAAPDDVRRFMAGQMLPLVERSLQAAADDIEVLNGKAAALLALGRLPEAAAACDGALALQPTNEATLETAALLAEQAHRFDDALAYRKKAAAVNPQRWQHRLHYARLLAIQGQWKPAQLECAAALRLNPASLEARAVQVGCLLDGGDKEAARAAFDVLLALEPPNRAELRRRYEGKLR